MMAASILLVEDNPLLLRTEQRLLESAGLEVHGFKDPTEALMALTSQRLHVDLALSDYMMRGMSGLEFFRQLRERFPDLPFLLTSGYAGSTDIAEQVQRVVGGAQGNGAAGSLTPGADRLTAATRAWRPRP